MLEKFIFHIQKIIYFLILSLYQIIWRHVIWGLSIQFVLASISLRWSFGRSVFNCMSTKTADFIEFTDEGSKFIFGELVDKHIFAFSVSISLYNYFFLMYNNQF